MHARCQVRLLLLWRAGICGKNQALLMVDEEKGRDEDEGESVLPSEVAAQEAPLGPNQNSPLLKPSHHGRPMTALGPPGGVEGKERSAMAKTEAGQDGHIDG